MTLRYSLLLALCALVLTPMASAQLVINEVHYDPADGAPGDANGDGARDGSQDEFVEIVNTGTAAVDLSGFVIEDEASFNSTDATFVRHTFPAGTTVAPGQAVVVFGGGTPTGAFGGSVVQTASSGQIGLNNSGDTVYLVNTAGTTVVQYAYDGAVQDQALARNPDRTGAFVAHNTITTNVRLFSPGLRNQDNAAFAGGQAAAGPTVAFTAATAAGTEGGTVTLTLRINYGSAPVNGTPVTATVAFTATGSTATAADFTGPTPAQVTFSGNTDGETKTVAVALAANDGAEQSETAAFAVTVSGGSATVGTPSTATITITDGAALAVSTLAQARAAGPGTRVRVQGTVTRAKGGFAYFQDATAGLVIRQVGNGSNQAFVDAIASGAIKAGTVLDVTGTLSEFRGLLQLNNAGLESYTATGTAAVPAAQVLTLAQIASNGEAYESELVRVQNLTFAMSGTFAAGTNYDVTDGSAPANPVQVRVINADDTDVDGLAIPAGPSSVTGVLGQFDDTAPLTEGYQIQPIQASDVAQGTPVELGPDTALGMAVANPLRGTVTVEFALATPGRAQVALFDALGRRVAVLADGAFGTGTQTATVDAGTLAAGVYVLRLQGEAGALSRTVTVVR